MANTDIPRGFHNPQSLSGSAPSVTVLTTTAVVFAGDPVTISGIGTCAATAAATTSPGGIAANHAASGASVAVYTNLGDLTFEAQVDDNTITSQAVGTKLNPIKAGGDTVTGQSGYELDGNAGSPSVCIVTDMVDRADNDVELTNNKLRVKFLKYADATVA